MAEDQTRMQIIAKIRRIAAENGGAPPGIKRFATLTGVKRTLWQGRFWARWSDALTEAGFSPNPRQEPLEDADMLAAMAEAARRLQRIPTDSELCLLRRAGVRIPTNQTYIRHFGSKPGWLWQLKNWTAQTPGWDDVAALLADVPDPPEPDLRPKLTGAVYLLRFGSHHKIGCSEVPDQRVVGLQQMLPPGTNLVHLIKTDDPYGVENYWHRRFAAKRIKGEWFKLSRQDIAAFRRWRCQ